ncbi:SDR family oxidoreductase [Aquimarina agarilytica]|uniref:SDR family oxidoreductase n=1 Tax=Aquimarina agarilytica TaxID=1087449 RepID=UPI000289BB89|nr:SDR family oxidoreductase [Aquimarina agarilytica]
MILVTGGTGLVGVYLLMELAKNSALPIRATYRSLSKKAAAEQVFKTCNTNTDFFEHWKRIEWIQADITEIPALEKAFDGVTQVYHCAGFISWNVSDFDQLKKVNIEGTANMVNLSLSKKVEKFCHVSSIATLNLNPGETIFTEASQWNPEAENSVYAISKFGGEMEVQRGMQEGLPAVIVNPGVIIGAGFYASGSGELFAKVAKGVPFYTTGKTGYVGVWDVVKLMHALMKTDKFGERFILVSENITGEYVLKTIAKLINAKPAKRSIAKKWVLMYAYMQHFFSVILNIKPSIPLELVDSLYTASVYENKKIVNGLNLSFEKMDVVFKRVALDFLK